MCRRVSPDINPYGICQCDSAHNRPSCPHNSRLRQDSRAESRSYRRIWATIRIAKQTQWRIGQSAANALLDVVLQYGLIEQNALSDVVLQYDLIEKKRTVTCPKHLLDAI